MASKKVIIMGAAGRDFHNFNVVFRNNPDYEVVAFTATQIPDIEGRLYPAALAGKLYPKGIPIHDETDLGELIDQYAADEVIFSYSDVTHEHVMHAASFVNAMGPDFRLIGSSSTMLESNKPVISICATRTGCGKSQTTRRVTEILKAMDLNVVSIRHPMPYGDLAKQAVQRFATLADLKKHKCTIEEMEEYEPHINAGNVIYAGVDYEAILREAEKEADVILWDGGNNDTSFYLPDLLITVVDPLRAGHETSYYPGETNLLQADVIVINKIDSASMENMDVLRSSIRDMNPYAVVVDAASPVSVEEPEIIEGKRVLVVEDGPTLTHGEMKIGAGTVAAMKHGAEIVDPRPWLKGSLLDTFEKYPDIGPILPAMGYGAQQVKDLEASINAADVDAVVIGTPIDLRRVVKIRKPSTRVSYDLDEIGRPDMEDVIGAFLYQYVEDRKAEKEEAEKKTAKKKVKKTPTKKVAKKAVKKTAKKKK
ncbi:MAG: cyclic 2,3-diphosphoglycerate synthase [Candidatus Krumholzibacteria bacterium]|jgi:predicted GTPase|nr:cyclic 2,3-diphosphoglycerate synthase [Candidatus Krumholzibacteria bacterium]MDP6669408.1 cyclic 2,3-diphosphoglycerate synthase [Candidatus Krumholzibacteria bacterium]MDP6798020.1 cyclic 2,3-diphosphoglycerate synthase [Candidatus Krumholzibacteria bacterium]MDP7021533.1 cyclic 2,3-diphosphoglycerate synthase [Candidatus Krumholzibacteria bacterium]